MDPYFRELLRRRRKQMAEVAAASEDPRAGDIGPCFSLAKRATLMRSVRYRCTCRQHWPPA